jgi:DNA-binding PadR family transcriptional regulator
VKSTPLNAFILSLLDRGQQTPYDLHSVGAVSLGASLPALRDLTKERLVTRAINRRSGKRARHEYTLTAAGRETARSAWQSYLDGDPVALDLDSLLRIADMALYYGGNRAKIGTLLSLAARHRQSLGKQAEIATAGPISNAQHLYSTMRAACDVKRFLGEANALTELAKKFRQPKKNARKHGKVEGQKELDIPSQ